MASPSRSSTISGGFPSRLIGVMVYLQFSPCFIQLPSRLLCLGLPHHVSSRLNVVDSEGA